ncbi:DUF4056 domain-containing protein [Paraferrimonas haliotis]|uniref:DUF4056 domain-containing protein n=1 Tax=Paraferrimonas haliotis TaxID=2013866 RepID=UPI000BA9C6C8|nr:DUF4056 domain-containing protein [Paraferrimonas haliotis]
MINRSTITTMIILLLAMVASGCTSSDWSMSAAPSTLATQQALSDTPDPTLTKEVHFSEQSVFELPTNVRPCCAFGHNQKVAIYTLPVPLFRLSNSVDFETIGAHGYGAGSFSYQRPAPNQSRRTENNGLIYTQRGGFIDLAHVRDTADLTVALFYRIHPNLGKPHRIDLPPELGPRHIELSNFSVDGLSAEQRWQLAASLSARLAYFMAEAHEIAQGHGYRSFAPWSEAVSAYSVEDLYSNMLGAKLALAILNNHQAATRQQFNFHMTQWLKASLLELEAVPIKQTNALLDAVDGYWWNSNEPLPNKFTLLLRHYQLGDRQSPYLVASQLAQRSEHWPLLQSLYHGDVNPLNLSLQSELFGIQFDRVAKLWLSVEQRYADSFAHIPEPVWGDGFNHTQFATIAQFDERLDKQQLSLYLETNPHLAGPKLFERN